MFKSFFVSIQLILVSLSVVGLVFPSAALATPFYGFRTVQPSDTPQRRFSIDQPVLAYQQEKLLFVSPIATDSATFTQPVAAAYQPSVRGSEAGWRIVSLSGEDIPPEAEFMVVAVDLTEESGAFIHTHGEGTVISNSSPFTVLDHPRLNNDPQARFIVGHRVNRVRLAGISPSPVVVEYVAPNWRIRTTDGSPIPRGYQFNVLVNEAILQTATTSGQFAKVNDPRLSGKPSLEMIATPVVEKGQPYPGGDAFLYTDFSISGRVERDNWYVARKRGDTTKVRYNIFAPNLDGERRYRIFTAGPEGWKEDYFVGAIPMTDPLDPSRSNLIDLDAVSFDVDLDLTVYETIPDPDGVVEPTETAVRHTTAQGVNLTKYLQNQHGQNLGTYTLTDGMLMTVSIDLDLDGLADHIATHNLWTGRSKYIVAETEEALRNWEELLQGINTFCRMNEVREAPGAGPLIGLGQGVPTSTIINGCDPFGTLGSGGSGVGGLPQAGGIGAMCDAVMAGASVDVLPEAIAGYGEGLVMIAEGVALIVETGGLGAAVGTVGIIGGAWEIWTTFRDGETQSEEQIIEQLRGQSRRLGLLAGSQRTQATRNREIASEAREAAARERRDGNSSRARSADELAEAYEDSARRADRNAQDLENQQRVVESRLSRLGAEPSDPTGDGRNGVLEFCQRYEANKDCYSFAGLERNLAQARSQCESPVASTGGNLGGTNITESQCPFFPLDPRGEIENTLFCAEPETFFDLGSVVGEMCINPVASPTPDGYLACPSSGGRIGGASVDYTYLGVASPEIDRIIKVIDDMVVNPGDPIYFERPDAR